MSSELDKIIAAVTKQHGSAVIVRGGKIEPCERIPTGIFNFDLATGGGIPRGRLTEIYGPESSGKTSVSLLLIAHVQKVLKQKAVFIDLENSLDFEWAARLGVDIEDLIVLYPDSAEQAVDFVEAFLHVDEVGIVVLDSLAAMTPQNEIDSSADKQIVGGSSALAGKMMRKVGVVLKSEMKRDHKPAFLVLNQIRHKIGVMFGDPETTPGGNSPRFAYNLRIRLYAKDKMVESVSKDFATFRTVSGIIKKWKVPIVARNFEYDFCLIPHDNVGLGQSPSWNTVASKLKEHGLLAKTDKGWICQGVEFKTIAQLQALYNSDEALQRALQKDVVDAVSKKMLAPTGANDEPQGFVDMTTGEIIEE